MKVLMFFSNGNKAVFDPNKVVFVSDTDTNLNVLTEHPDWIIVNRNTVCFMRFVKEDNDD